MTVVLVFHRLGPYHVARLRALSARVSDVTAVEISGVDNVYQWDAVGGSAGFGRVTVAPDHDADALPLASYARRLHALLDEVGPEVVAIAGWSAPWALSTLDWCRKNKVPSVLMSDSTVDDAPRTAFKEYVKRRLVKLYDAALVAGTPHREYVCRLGMAPERVFEGYDVVDNEHFSAGAAAARSSGDELRRKLGLPSRYFLASARFVEKKNLFNLIKGYAEYRQATGPKGWGLVLLGDGPLRNELVAEVSRLNLESDVLFSGFRQYDELPAYYGLASTFVHSSTVEQWGLVVNEAMASGLPVLVSKRCGCALDLVADGVNGYVFDPFDVSELAAKMMRLSSGGADTVALARSSAEAIGRWTPDVFADQLLKACAVAQESGPGPRGIAERFLLWGVARR